MSQELIFGFAQLYSSNSTFKKIVFSLVPILFHLDVLKVAHKVCTKTQCFRILKILSVIRKVWTQMIVRKATARHLLEVITVRMN